MRSTHRLPTSAFLAAALVLAGMAVAQPPDRKQEPPRGLSQVLPDQPNPISVDDIVERIMSFDKNKDGKVTKDELPERMHHLIEQGDTNKDGALDRDEVKKLAARMATAPGGFGAGGFRVAGSGPGAPGGFGPRGEFGVGGFRVSGSVRDVGRVGPGPGIMEGVVEDLKLPGKKKDQAMAAVKAHEENVRKLMDQARADLLKKVKEILSEEEFKDFQAALDRPRGGISLITADGPKPGDVQRRIEQLQKELDDLRRESRR
jgi:hypothetical protein